MFCRTIVRALALKDSSRGYWIGIHDNLEEGKWMWVTGFRAKDDDLTLWEFGEPNSYNGTDEDCAISFFGKYPGGDKIKHGQLLHDISCNERHEKAICEKLVESS